MYAEPITIEKDGEVFDIFFIDSEGLMPKMAPIRTDLNTTKTTNQQ